LHTVIKMDSLIDYYMNLFGTFDSWTQCLGKIFYEIIKRGEELNETKLPGDNNHRYSIKFDQYDDYADITVSYDGVEGFDIYRIFTKEKE